MSITPRRLRAVWVCASLFLVAIACVAVVVNSTGSNPQTAEVSQPLATSATVEVERLAPAPLHLILGFDRSGSMRSSDPDDTVYQVARDTLSHVLTARPAPAVTLFTPIYFGTHAYAGPTSMLEEGAAVSLGTGDYLGYTDFAAALREAVPVVESFLGSEAGRDGRPIVIVATDGAPALPQTTSPAAIWPGIEAAVQEVRSAGAEVYLIGFAESSVAWNDAAARWRALLGEDNVLLASDVLGVNGLFSEFSRTALALDYSASQELETGGSARLQARSYTDSLNVRVTALEADSEFRLVTSEEPTGTPVALSARGERVTLRQPAGSDTFIEVLNTGPHPILVGLERQTAVLRPMAAVPCAGAPVDGLILELADGLGKKLVSSPADPVALGCLLTWQDPDGGRIEREVELRPLEDGLYEARSSETKWPASSARLTVLTRSVGGEVGRQDYSIEPTAAAWPALVEPGDMFALPEKSKVPIEVVVEESEGMETEQSGASGTRHLVSAEVFDHEGVLLDSLWLESEGSRFTGALPGPLGEGLLRLSVIDTDGALVSSRDIVYRMRMTPHQVLLERLLASVKLGALILAVLVGAAVAYLLSKRPLSGSLVIKASEAAPRRYPVYGRRVGLLRLDDALGRARILVLPHSPDAVRVLLVGLIPKNVLLRRGAEVPFTGRSLRLV